MEEQGIILNCNGLLTAAHRTSSSKECAENLLIRIRFLSNDKSVAKDEDVEKYLKEWNICGEKVIVNKDRAVNNPDTLCLCGHSIEKMCIVINERRQMAQIGLRCIERFLSEIYRKYKKGLKRPFYCDVCEKVFLNRESHLKTKAHGKKWDDFVIKRKSLVSFNANEKLIRYMRSLEVPGVCEFCGNVKDMRKHRTSASHKWSVEKFAEREIGAVLETRLKVIKQFGRNFNSTFSCRLCPNRISSSEKWKQWCLTCYYKHIKKG